MRSNLRPSARAIERPSEVLPTPGGPTKQQDRARRHGLERSCQLAHREELEDPVLDLLDVVVVGVEHLAGVREVEVVLGRLVPRQRRDPLEVGADDAVLGHRRLQALEPAAARARPACATSSGSSIAASCSRSSLDLGLHLVALAELLLDRLQLLAQEVLALALVQLGLDLRLDLGADRDHLELAREDLRQPPQPLGRRRPPRAATASPRCCSRSAPAIRCVSALGSSTLATIIWSSSGRYGTCPTMSENVCCTLRISAVSSG